MNAIEIKNLSYKYQNGTRMVIKDLSLEVEAGKFVAVLGHNGSGKSTLAKLINGLFTATEGEVKVFGMDTADKNNLFEIRKKCGLVFQNPDNQMIATIVEDDVAFGPENIGLPRAEIKERIDFALKATGTEEFRTSSASKLSGGQKQRVAIAGVLAIKPDILILDESTAMLDPKGREEVMGVVKQLNDDGMTVIVITHYLEEAVSADEVIVMHEGEIIKKGTPLEVFNDTYAINRAGLGLPRAKYIADELNKNGVPVGDGILTRKELSERLCKLLVKD